MTTNGVAGITIIAAFTYKYEEKSAESSEREMLVDVMMSYRGNRDFVREK